LNFSREARSPFLYRPSYPGCNVICDRIRIVLDTSAVVTTVNTWQFGVSSHLAINSWQLETAEEVTLHWIEDWIGESYHEYGANEATNNRNAARALPLRTGGTIVDPPEGRNERGHKTRQDKLHAYWANADRERRRADMKAFNKMRDGREAERKAYKQKMMAEWEAEWKKRKADFEKRMDQEESRRKRSGGKAGSHSRQDRRQPDETGTLNGTSREDGCQSEGNIRRHENPPSHPSRNEGHPRKNRCRPRSHARMMRTN
jgi:hypothetical protein